MHYSYEGNLIPIDSDEAKAYFQKDKFRDNRPPIFATDVLNLSKTIPVVEVQQSNENDEDDRTTVASDVTETSEAMDDLVEIRLNLDASPDMKASLVTITAIGRHHLSG